MFTSGDTFRLIKTDKFKLQKYLTAGLITPQQRSTAYGDSHIFTEENLIQLMFIKALTERSIPVPKIKIIMDAVPDMDWMKTNLVMIQFVEKDVFVDTTIETAPEKISRKDINDFFINFNSSDATIVVSLYRFRNQLEQVLKGYEKVKRGRG